MMTTRAKPMRMRCLRPMLLAVAVLILAGSGWGVRPVLAQDSSEEKELTPEEQAELERKLQEAAANPEKFVEEQSAKNRERWAAERAKRAGAKGPRPAEAGPVDMKSEFPPGTHRPRNMREYAEMRAERARRKAGTASTKPAASEPVTKTTTEADTKKTAKPVSMDPKSKDMRLEADKLPEITDAELKKLAAEAAEEARALKEADKIIAEVEKTTTTQPSKAARSPKVITRAQLLPPTRSQTTRPAATPSGADQKGVAKGPDGKPEILKARWWNIPYDKRPYFVSWKNTPVEKVLEDFSVMSGLSWMGLNQIQQIDKALLTKLITFESVRIMDYDEALTTLDLLLVDFDYWVCHSEDYLEIRKLTEWYRRVSIDRMYRTVEAYKKAALPAWELAVVLYDPKEKSSQLLAEGCVDLVPLNAARATVVPESGEIELKGFVYYLNRQLAWLEEHAVSAEDPRELVEYQLENTSTSEAVRLLYALMPPAGGVPRASTAARPPTPSRSRGSRTPTPAPAPARVGPSLVDAMEIVEEPRRSVLLIKATPVKHERIKDYLATYIDLPVASGRAEFIKVEHADVGTLAEVIRSLLGKQTIVQTPPPPVKPGQPPKPAPPPRLVTHPSTATLTPLPHMKSLLVKAEPDDMTQIKEYIKMLDVPEGEQIYEYIKLKSAKASELSPMLMAAVGRSSAPGRTPSAGLSSKFQALPLQHDPKGLLLIGEQGMIDKAKELIAQLDVDASADAIEKLIRLKRSSPSTVQTILSSRYGGSVSSPYSRYGARSAGGEGLPKFIANDQARLLIVVCREEMWPDIERLINELDSAAAVANTTKTYQLKYVSATAVTTILTKALIPPTHTRYSIDPTAPVFGYDYETNLLVITATDEMHEKVGKLLAELDRPGQNQRRTYPISLANASPSDLSTTLREIYTTAGYSRGRGVTPPVFTTTPGGGKLLVTCTAEQLEQVQELLKDLDSEDAAADRMITETIRLQHASAEELSYTLATILRNQRSSRNYYAPQPMVQALSSSNALLINATQRQIDEIRDLLVELDVPSEGGMVVKVYAIENSDLSSVVSAINTAFRASYSRYGGARSMVTATLDYGTGSVIVSATEENHKKVKDLIDQLDEVISTDRVTLEPIQLEHADTDYVAQKLEEMFGESSLMSSRRRSSYSSADTLMRIITDPIGNRLLISGPRDDFEQAKAFAEEMDRQYASQDYIRKMFFLENIEPYEAESVIQTMFGDSSGGSYGGRSSYRSSYYRSSYSSASKPGSIKIVEAGRGLIVYAPKDKMAEIEALIKELDTDPSGKNEMRTYKVKGAGSRGTSQIAQNLDQLYNARSGGSGYYGSSNKATVKFIGSYYNDLLFVSAPSDKMEEVDKFVQDLLAAQEGADLTMIIRHFDIEHAQAQSLVEMIQPIVESRYRELKQQSGGGSYYSYSYYGSSSGPQLIALPTGKRIMVQAPEQLMELIQQLIDEFDTETFKSTMRIIHLDVAKADQIAPIIEQMMSEKSSSSSSSSYRYRSSRHSYFSPYSSSYGNSGGGAGELIVTALPSSNSLILKGPEQKVYEAEQLVLDLDKNAEPEGNILKVYKIEHASLYDVVGMIEDIVGGGGGGLYGMSAMPEGVVVQPEYTTNSIIVSAPREKLPMIEQVIELRESIALAKDQAKDEYGGTGDVVGTSSTYGTITKAYDVEGPADEIAAELDRQLLAYLGYSAPYVKSIPFAKQILVEGKPEQFEQVEKLLESILKNPPKPRTMLMVRRVKKTGGMSAARVVQAFQRYASAPVEVKEIPSLSVRPDPLTLMTEIEIDTPITTQPAGAPFVPTGAMREMQESLAALSWLQGATTKPAAPTTKPATPTTKPAAAAKPTTKPAVVKKPAPKIKVVAKPEPKPEVKPAPKADAKPVADAAAKPAPKSKDQQTREAVMDMVLQVEATSKVQLRYDEEEGLIIAMGPAHELEEMQKLLDQIIGEYERMMSDDPDVTERPIRVFQLQHVDVTIAAAILEQMFNEQAPKGKKPAPKKPAPKKPKVKAGEEEGEEGSIREKRKELEEEGAEEEGQVGGEGRIRVVPDSRTRTLIIRAAQEDFPRIAELLLKIDRPTDKPARDIKIFQLKNLNAYEVEQAIKAILKIQDTTRGRIPYPGAYPRGSSSRGGMNQAAMMAQLEAQMLEMRTTAGEGEEGGGKLKINPAKDITLASDAMTNSIIVSAPDEGMRLVERLINDLEALDIPLEIKSIVLENADAEAVAGEIEKIFRSASRSRRASAGPGDGITPSRLGNMSIAADPRTNTIVVRALEPDMQKIEPIIQELDADITEGLVQIYPVEQGDAAQRAKTLSTLFASAAGQTGSRAITITADPDTNTLLVKGPESWQKLIEARNKALDGRVGSLKTPRQIELEYALPSTVASKLSEIFITKARRRSGTPNEIKIVGDDTSRVLFVTANEEMFKEIETIARQMDNQTPMETKPLALVHARAEEIVRSFQTLLKQAMSQLGGGGSFQVVADEASNSLVLTGSKAVHEQAQIVLASLDQKPDDDTEVTTTMYSLTKADASTVATTARTLFAGHKFPGGVKPPTIVPVTSSNVVYIYGTTSQAQMIKKSVIDPLEATVATKDVAVKDFVIPAQYVKAEDLASSLSQWWSSRIANMRAAGFALLPAETAVSIQADPVTKRLLVSCTEENYKTLSETAKQFDIPEAGEGLLQVKTFPLKYANASYTYSALVNIFTKRGRVPESEQVSISVEYESSTLIVRANKDNMAKIEKLLAEIDVDAGSKQLTEPIKIKYVLASEVSRQLTSMMRSKKRTRQGLYPTFSAIDETNTLMVNATAKEIEEIRSLIALVDTPPDAEAEREMRIYMPKFAAASSIITIINTSFAKKRTKNPRDQVTAVAESSTGALVVYASPKNHEQVAKIVDDLDNSDMNKMTAPESIPVKYVLASQLAATLNDMIRASKRPDRATRRYPVTVTANDLSNNLLVTAISSRELEEIKTLITQLDVEPTQGDDRIIKPYVVQYADLNAMSSILTTRFAANRNRAIRDQVLIQAEYTTGHLVVTASPENHEKVAALLAELDRGDTGRQPILESIKVENVRASILAGTLSSIIRQRFKRDRYTGVYPVSVSPDDSSNSLLVNAAPVYLEETKQLIATLDVAPEVGTERILKAYPVKFVDLSSMLNIVNARFSDDNRTKGIQDQVTATVEWASGSLVVTASPKNHEVIQGLLDELDTGDRGEMGMQFETIQVANAKASTLANTLYTIIRQTMKIDRRLGVYPVSVTADDASNTLLVNALQPRFMDQMKSLIEKLDVKPNLDDDRVITPYSVRYADLGSLTNILNQRFAANTALAIREHVSVTAEYSTGTLVVTASPENHEKVSKLIEDLDKVESTPQTYPFEIVHGEPDDIALALTTIYNAIKPRDRRTGRVPATFTVPRGSRKILVSTTQAELPEIEKLIAEMDVEESPDQKRDVRVVTVTHMTATEMGKILTEYMRRPGKSGTRDPRLIDDVKILASDATATIALTGPEDRLNELEQLAEKIDVAKGEGGDEEAGRQIKVFALEQADPSSVASVITNTFRKTGTVPEAERVYATAERTTNSVVVSASLDNLEDIEEIIVNLDSEGANVPEERVIKLKHAQAEDLATVLTATYRARPRRSGGPQISINADSNLNALVVSSGKADFDGIAAMVEQLDRPATDDLEQLHVIPLEWVDATEMLEIMTEYLRKPSASRRRSGSDLAGDIRLQASQAMNALIVSGSQEEIENVEKIVKGMDQEVEGAGTAPRIIEVEHSQAAQLASTLTQMFTDPATKRRGRSSSPEMIPLIMADENTNSLIVRARTVDYNLIESMAHKLDTETTGLSGMKVIQVSRGVDVRQLAREIERTVNQGESFLAKSQPGYRPGQVAIGVDERAPALIVAGSRHLFDTVTKLVDELQSLRPSGAVAQPMIIRIKHGQSEEIKKALQQFINQQSGKGSARR